ncbi:Phytochrome A [Striga hermonthica]|uniref:Phytochrome A n=1 Tax=Striga hermonthica TaxID=68872 RepID=A0A9N7NN76_STRHE|nr:Phytochrome A [Striga hermonthica]
MAAQQPSSSSTNPTRSRHTTRIVAQTSIDARLQADFDKSGTSFDYSSSVRVTNFPFAQIPARSDMATTTTYLQQIQKGKLIQSFGCLLVLHEKTFKVIAFSENAPEMLTTLSHAVPSVGDHPLLGIGSDIRTIFTAPSAAALQKAFGFGEVALLNPVLVHCKSSGKPFYAIIHRVTGSLVIDFEPVKPHEVPMTAAGALQSYKLAAKAITRLQSLPSGSLERLCETMAQEVFELTGYDRVMVYKFHEDDHGEVFAEVTRPGLEPYLGLHYPATDIPQAARFLFMKNKVRMICDCRAAHVKVVQDECFSSDLTLCGSTLRAPHSCHLRYMENMNSIASLVMSVVINEGTDEESSASSSSSSHPDKQKRLWGLVVCHHTSPRFVPFPLRYACEFLSQVFSIHVGKELELLNQTLEKNILKTQTLLCDMLLRGNPLAVVTQSPTVMDLVKCDGAVFLYKGKNHRLGLAPSDLQILDIVSWLDEYHRDSTGMTTDSLLGAGFPGAAALGDAFCGMAAVRITGRDWLFWFRSHTAAEVQWGGAKQEKGDEDDGRKMHPRSSFKAFLEVVKARSVPWRDFEMDAIHSLQLILRNACDKEEEEEARRKDMVVAGEIQSRLNELHIDGAKEMEMVTSEMVRLIETASVPILAVGVDGLVNGWNTKIAELTGLPVDGAIGQKFLALVEESSVDVVRRMLELALQGQEEQNVHFEIKTHGARAESGPISLVVNACTSRDIKDDVVGVCFIAQDVTTERSMMDKFTRIEGDYQAIVQNPNPLIPPIFGLDEFGWCSEWNPAMAHLSGWQREEVIDKMLLGEVFGLGKACCRLKNQESYVNLGILLNKAVTGQDSGRVPFGFFSREGKYVDCLLSMSTKVDREGAVTGLFCFLQLPSPELQQALHVQRVSEQIAMKRLRVMAYIRSEIKNPLSGIIFSRKMMEGTDLDDEQRNLLRTTQHCQRQLNKILDDTDIDQIIEGYLDLEMVEFKVPEVLIAAISQIMMKSSAKGITIVDNLAPNLDKETVYGDSVRLQQVLAAFLLVSVNSTPSGGQLSVAATLRKDSIGESVHLGHLEFRITHSGAGVPHALLDQMFGEESDTCEDGISLFVNRKLVKLMNGDVRYLREATCSTFIITVELAISNKTTSLRVLMHVEWRNMIKSKIYSEILAIEMKFTRQLPGLQVPSIKLIYSIYFESIKFNKRKRKIISKTLETVQCNVRKGYGHYAMLQDLVQTRIEFQHHFEEQ